MLRWPDAAQVEDAVRRWAEQLCQDRADVLRIGYFGSYARGDWGVGSDLDLIVVLDADCPGGKHAVPLDTRSLPVPADLIVYTRHEWQALSRDSRFYRTLMREAVWLYETK